MNLRTYASVTERRHALEKATGVTLSYSGKGTLDESVASSRHCENMVGVTQVPLGVAGPLVLSGTHTTHKKDGYFIPLATTEGALVASVSRGAKAITESGGAVVDSHQVGASRGPVFRVKSLKESDDFYRFLKDNLSELQDVAAATSHHLTLEKLLTRGVGRYRYVRFSFRTGDAMGMNMVTIATKALAEHIEAKTGVRCIALAGNFDNDKKPSFLNAIENRGIKVWAEVQLPESVLRTTLKTTATAMYEVWLAKCMVGSALSGSMGFNAQYANVIAAMFLATGQDLGHIGEGSMGITTAEVSGKDLYVSVTLPDLMVGTVGGGTALATQQEALALLGVAGGNDGANARTFAEIIGAAVLAGEVSLIASLAEGTLATAHERLARGKK